MTPGARIAAAIGLLDEILAGQAAEQALTRWARASRFAGSGDRAAVRDLVFDALRRRRSWAALGGEESGRGLMLGRLVEEGLAPDALFTGAGHAPPPLSAEERRRLAQAPDLASLPRGVQLDLPDWLRPELAADLGADLAPVAARLRSRAPVFVRVNLARAGRDEAAQALAREGIETRPVPLAGTALEVTANARRLRGARAWQEGLIELQDAASQAACAEIPLTPGTPVLDYCAGGGGKALALAARGARVSAHDAAPRRMRDLPARAARAGAEIGLVSTQEAQAQAPWPVVVTDVPCSGSGTWARAPQAKWALTPARLAELEATQRQILDEAAALVAPGGRLVYITCSLLARENEAQIQGFMARHPSWQVAMQRRISPLEGGDGFYICQLTA